MFLWESPTEGRPSGAAWRATGAFGAAAIGQCVALALWERGVGIASEVWFGAALVVLAIGVPWRRGPNLLVLALAMALLSSGVFSHRVLRLDGESIARLIPPASTPGGGGVVTVEGVVVGAFERREPTGALASFVPFGGGSFVSGTVRVDRALDDRGARPVTGRARVSVRSASEAMPVPGDRVRVTGVIRAIDSASNPGQADPRLRAMQSGVVATIESGEASLVVRIAPRSGVLEVAQRWWLRGRALLESRVREILPEDQGGARAMLGALLLGERDAAGDETRATFARQGVAHVLAISGFHLAVMAGAALFAIRLTGDRGRLEPVLVALLVVVYVLVLPARAPIIRASSMVLVWIVAESLGRRYDPRAVLAWVAIGVMLVRPMDLFTLGYQLTFGITAALMWFGEPFHARLFPGRLTFERRESPDAFERRWWFDRGARLVSASVLCWVVATPLVAHATGVVSPYAVPTTVVVVPIVTVLLWAGFGVLLVGLVVPGAGALASGVLEGVASVVLSIVWFADTLPGSSFVVPPLSVLLVIAWTVVLAWSLMRGHWRSAGLWAAILLLVGWTGLAWRDAGRVGPGVLLRVDAFDVGDGTCVLVRSGEASVLWDCGSLRPGLGVWTLPRALRAFGVYRLDLVVISHPNFDHFSALPDLMRRVPVDAIGLGEATARKGSLARSGATAFCLAEVRRRGIPTETWSAGREVSLGEARGTVLSPPEPSPFRSDNDNSLVVMLEVETDAGVRRLLLTGDAQRESLAALMTPGADLRADVLELPHHGSVQPTALDFVDLVDPSVVLQSTGPSRALDVRWNAQRIGRDWWTTATDGAAWVEIRADGSIASGSVRR